MKKILLPSCIIALLSLTACGGNPPNYDVTATEQTTSFPTSTVTVDSPKNIFTDTSKALGQPTNQAAPPLQVQAAPAKSSGKLNPAHGQPGHRCDIAVGAPLSSPPQQVQSAANVQATPVQATPAPAPKMFPAQPQAKPTLNAGGTAKLNPAHGQPGHDCAIPVGQPLKTN